MILVTTATNNGGWRWTFPFPHFSTTRKATLPLRIDKPNYIVVASSESNAKRANLFASRTQRVQLPVYDDETSNGTQPYHISQFLSHPSGIQAILNTGALQNFQVLDTNAYRCTLPKLALFNFEATPVLDLRVIPTKEDCTVELFSCKFKGSKVLERQNDHFSATMINHITWDTNIPEPFLEVDVKLNLSLEIYTQPFILLPVAAVERPGNLMIQALVDGLVPMLLQQLLQDYDKWVDQQRHNFLTN